MMDEARILRLRDAAGAAEATRLDDPRSPPPGPMLVKTITQTTYPTAASRVYAVQAVEIDVAEAEGNTPSFSDVTGTFYAVNVGGSVPPLGTRLLAWPASGRWVISYG